MHAVGDGLDPIRERIQQYGLTRERRLQLALERLQEDERRYLERFADAEAKGAPRMPAHLPTCMMMWLFAGIWRARLPLYCLPSLENCPATLWWPPPALGFRRQLHFGCTAGDEAWMASCQSLWKTATEKLELLKRDPQAFVRRWGYLYGIED